MGIFDKLKKVVEDITELEVVTLSGNVTIPAAQAGDLKFENIMSAAAEGEVKLVASTKVDLDGDTHLFVAENSDEDIRALHQQAVKTAQETRAAIFELVKGVVKDVVN